MKNLRVGILNNKLECYGKIDIGVFIEKDIKEIKGRNPGEFIKDACRCAEENNIFLVPGLYIRNGFLCTAIIDNKGNMLWEQRAAHLNTLFFGELNRSTDIIINDTPFGKIYLCPDVDIYKPEVLRAAALLGAQTVISSQFIRDEDYCEEMILAGAWQEAQQNCIYVVNSTNYGGNIIGPCQAVEDLSGFIARGDRNSSVFAELSGGKIKAAYSQFPIFNTLNKLLYCSCADELGY